MATKIEYYKEFERSKKLIAVQGVIGGSGSVTIIDKMLSVKDTKDLRLSVKHTKNFDHLYEALVEFKAISDELMVREDRADMVAETIRKCNGE